MVKIFTAWAFRPIQSTSRDVRLFVCLSVCLSVCLFVCAIVKHPLLDVVETSGKIASSLYFPAITYFQRIGP